MKEEFISVADSRQLGGEGREAEQADLVVVVMVGVDVVVDWLGRVPEMVVVNILGDPVQEEGVGEHLRDVGDVILRHILRAAVVLQNLVSFGRVLLCDLQGVLVKQKQRSPKVPIVDHRVEKKIVSKEYDLCDKKSLILVCAE